MSAIGPWLVVGGAALVVVCVVLTLTALRRGLRRSRPSPRDARAPRSALAQAAAGAGDDDALMPLLVAAALDVARADAAVVTFVRTGDRRRSYSANLDVAEARSVIDALVAGAPGPLPAHLVVPVERRTISGALGVYWRHEGERDVQPTDLEELIALAFPAQPGVEAVAHESLPEESERWSRLADFNGTLEPEALLRKIVAAALADCGADAAAGRIAATDLEPVSEVSEFDEHEFAWTESVLASEPLVASITRYLVRSDEASIGTAIVVPLRDADGGATGSLVAVWRRDLGGAGDTRLAELELLADDARAALGNAIRFRQLQSIAAGTVPAAAASKPGTTPVVTGPMRLSVGGTEEWTLRTPAPEREPPEAEA
jgi:hypothetical protein